jgi:hypothetical protein
MQRMRQDLDAPARSSSIGQHELSPGSDNMRPELDALAMSDAVAQQELGPYREKYGLSTESQKGYKELHASRMSAPTAYSAPKGYHAEPGVHSDNLSTSAPAHLRPEQRNAWPMFGYDDL